jgi:hypothetical protein
MISLFQCARFNHVWVVQEVQLANEHTLVRCGNDAIYWHAIRKAVVVLSVKIGIPPELTLLLSSNRPTVRLRTRMTFLDLLSWIRERQCTDPRDKVYGVLSLASNSISKSIQPQYSSPVSQVYRDALLAHINLTKRLDMLADCSLEHRYNDGPSWIPNWDTLPPSFHYGGQPIFARQSSGLSAAQSRYLAPHTLEVIGRHHATILQMASLFPRIIQTLNLN